MANPWDSAPIVQPWSNAPLVKGTGPKAPSGYQAVDGGLAPIAGGPQDPQAAARMAAAEAAARASASTPIETAAQMALIRARQQAELGTNAAKLAQERSLGPKLTGEDREKAIKAAQAGNRIDALVADMERLYQQGPGATSGIAGLQDYLPTTANKRFDAAGNSVRGDVGQALGFTSSQLNTPAETAAAVGPYLPQANDRDAVILDKIDRLKGIARDARERAVKSLGSDPEAASLIGAPAATPASAPPPGGGMDRSTGVGAIMGPNGGGAPGSQFSGDSGFKTEEDPARAGLNARVNQLLQSGASDDQVRQFLASTGLPGVIEAAEPALKARQNGYKGAYSIDLQRQKIPLGGWDSMVNSLGTNAYSAPVAAYSANAADALTGGWLDNLSSNPTNARAVQEGLSKQNPNASLAGTVMGGALAAGGLEMGLGAAGARAGAGAIGRLLSSPLTADAAYGAVAGAGGADDGNRLLGAATGGAAGAVGGMFGRGIARGIGGAVGGVRNPSVQFMRDANIPMTAGMALGPTGKVGDLIRRTEQRVAGLPGVGDVVKGRYDDALEGINRRAFNEGVAPIGGNIDVIGPDGMRRMGAATNRGYTDATAGVAVAPDAQFGNEFGAAYNAGSSVPGLGEAFSHTVQSKVAPIIGGGPTMTGEAYQDALRLLRKNQNSYGKMDATGVNPLAGDVVDAFGGLEDSLTGLMGRGAPGTAEKLAKANEAYRNKKVLEAAVLAADKQGGRFTANQLARASIGNTRKFGGAAAAAEGRRPFADLTKAANEVFGDGVPDSGMAGRLVTAGGLAGLGAGGGYAAGDTQGAVGGTLGLGALLAAGGTKSGQKLLVKLLTDRPDWAIRAGAGLQNRARIGGMFGAGAAIPITSFLSGQ